jgi:hypothetical protein
MCQGSSGVLVKVEAHRYDMAPESLVHPAQATQSGTRAVIEQVHGGLVRQPGVLLPSLTMRSGSLVLDARAAARATATVSMGLPARTSRLATRPTA